MGVWEMEHANFRAKSEPTSKARSFQPYSISLNRFRCRGGNKFGFGAACDQLMGAESLQGIRKPWADTLHDSLFDQKIEIAPGGWIRRLHYALSNYSHSRPGL